MNEAVVSNNELKTNKITGLEINETPTGESRLSIPVSMVKGAKNNKIIKVVPLKDVFSRITSDDPIFSKFSTDLRHLKETNQEEYAKIKSSQCDGFIVGKFDKRNDKSCQSYFPLIGFDIDGLGDTPPDIFLADIQKSLYIFAAFPSPSFQGFRIFVWCDATPSTHKAVYAQVCEHLSEVLHLPTDKQLRAKKKKIKGVAHIDTGTNNVSRLWFFSKVEKDLFFLNMESLVFVPKPSDSIEKPVKINQNPHSQNRITSITDNDRIDLCLKKVERQNIPGGRNNFVFSFACELCKHGVLESLAMSECQKYREDGFNSDEIKRTVISAYKQKTFGEFSDKQILSYLNKQNSPAPPLPKQKKNIAPIIPPSSTENESGEKVKKNKFQQIEAYLFGNYEFRKNIISIEIEYRRRGMKNEWKELNENDLIIELMRTGWTGVEGPLIALLKSSLVPEYDPLKKYFSNLPLWDDSKPDYIKQLASYVETKDQHWFNTQFKKMLVRSAACALNIIPFNKQCFTLVGKQNDGKTSFIRFLCPPPLKPYFKENLDIQNKDGRIALCTNFFINLDELANFSKYEVTKTKAFFTIDQVKERLPYERKAATFKRRASFLASTNTSEFLTDETGNVRWLVFEIENVKHDSGGENGYNKNIDIDMVWAQVNYLLKNGFVYKLAPGEIVKSELNNKSHQVVTLEQEFIEERYKPATKQDYDAATLENENQATVKFKMTKDLLIEMSEHIRGYKTSMRAIGQALKVLGFVKSQKHLKTINQQRKGYYVKPINGN